MLRTIQMASSGRVMSWPLILPTEDQIITGFGGGILSSMPWHLQHECVVCTFLGGYFRSVVATPNVRNGKFWGGIGGNFEAVGNVLWVNVKDARPQIILYLRWGSYLGPSDAKRNEKILPKKAAF